MLAKWIQFYDFHFYPRQCDFKEDARTHIPVILLTTKEKTNKDIYSIILPLEPTA